MCFLKLERRAATKGPWLREAYYSNLGARGGTFVAARAWQMPARMTIIKLYVNKGEKDIRNANEVADAKGEP